VARSTGNNASPKPRNDRIGFVAVCAVTLLVYAWLAPRGHMAAPSGFGQLAMKAGQFFWVGTVLNPATSGLMTGLLPGVFNAISVAVCSAVIVLVVMREESWSRRFTITAFSLNALFVQLLLAASRWDRGATYASSYRYNYNNVAFELPALALVIGTIPAVLNANRTQRLLRPALTTLGAGLFALAIIGGIRGNTAFARDLRDRHECIRRLLLEREPHGCELSVYHRPYQAAFLREVVQLVSERRLQTAR
jgi:hypothetical protein